MDPTPAGLAAASDGELLLTLAVLAACSAGVAMVLVSVVRRLGRRFDIVVLSGRLWQSPIVVIAVLGTLQWAVLRADRAWSDPLAHVLWVAQVAAAAWLAIVVVVVMEKAALARTPDTGLAASGSRHRRTKITLIRRIMVATIITLAIGVVLWSIPAVRTLGLTVLASAGVLGIIAGLAAQTSLANIFAGVQVAFTDGIRVGDIVVIDEAWGRIEEITLTYVSVEVWDGTSLILPCTYFTTTPFRNWTHRGAAVDGTVVLRTDWTVDVERVRRRLQEAVADSGLWDGRRADLVVEDAAGPCLLLTAYVSAADGDTLGMLRWAVREALVTHLQREQPEAIPRERREVVSDRGLVDPPPPRRRDA